MIRGDRGGKEVERAGEKEYGVDKPLSFPVTVKMLSKLKLVLFWRVGKVPGDCISFTAYEGAKERRIDIHRDW